jgi:long-chain acyl-CoA synthetase
MDNKNLIAIVSDSIHKNWSINAFANYKEEAFTYAQVAERIQWMHQLFEKSGVQPGDKIAVSGKNHTNWALTFISVISYGAVVIPLLPDFTPEEIENLINHSDAVWFFASKQVQSNLDFEKMTQLKAMCMLEDFSLTKTNNNALSTHKDAVEAHFKKPLVPLDQENFTLPSISSDTMAAIVYTSGTTASSKGVMLNHKNFLENVLYGQRNMPLKAGDQIISFLPLAHVFGCVFEFLFPFSIGCQITFLGKIPSPKILVEAFKTIRPQLILSIPLIIEKIYKKQIAPSIEKPLLKVLMAVPGINQLIKKKIHKQVSEAFGGQFLEVIVGAAAINPDVEAFFKSIGFPFSVGYGMTECAPLISYAPWTAHRLTGVGRIVDELEVKIDSENPQKIAGEILVKGSHVMQGYYKNEEATKAAIDKEGWLHTGDLGLIDKDGFIYIKGRSKNMILGPSGQNIYPEEIETRLNNYPLVQESLIIEDNHKLVALIFPDFELAKQKQIDESKLEKFINHYKDEMNKKLSNFSQISKIKIQKEEFIKTPTKKIKRFAYQK